MIVGVCELCNYFSVVTFYHALVNNLGRRYRLSIIL